MATPPIPDGRCIHCHAPVVDLFAEWTDIYQTPEGKKAILTGAVVFDCYFCQQPLQLILPLALIAPLKEPGEYQIVRRRKSRCHAWLQAQHPGETLSQVVEKAGWQSEGRWAFDGYNWEE